MEGFTITRFFLACCICCKILWWPHQIYYLHGNRSRKADSCDTFLIMNSKSHGYMIEESESKHTIPDIWWAIFFGRLRSYRLHLPSRVIKQVKMKTSSRVINNKCFVKTLISLRHLVQYSQQITRSLNTCSTYSNK
jgi:hypothetical protein